MRTPIVLLTALAMLCGVLWTDQTLAQRDAMRTGEGMNVTRMPAPTIAAPIPQPESHATVLVPPQPDAAFENARMIGLVGIDVRRAPPYIRDTVRFLVAWGRRNEPELTAVTTPDAAASAFGAAAVPVRNVRLQLPASGIRVVSRTPDAATLDVRTVVLRDGSAFRVGHARLELILDGVGYRVRTVTVTK